MLHLHEGPYEGHTTDEIENRKSPAPGRIQSHDLSGMRHLLYRCATTAALRSVYTSSLTVRFFLIYFPSRKHFFLMDGAARVFPTSCAATGNQTQVCSVAPLFRDLAVLVDNQLLKKFGSLSVGIIPSRRNEFFCQKALTGYASVWG